MSNEELVDIIAETIYNHFRDRTTGIKTVDYYNLSEETKNSYRTIAHDIMCAYDDYYDNESEEIDDMDEDEMIDEDPYGSNKSYDEDWYDL